MYLEYICASLGMMGGKRKKAIVTSCKKEHETKMKEGNNVICLNWLEAQTGMDQSWTSLCVLAALDTLDENKK